MRSSLPLILCVLTSSLEAGEGQADWREQCRAGVSGTYLNYMNDLDVLKNQLRVSSESSFALKSRKILSVNELKALEAKNEKLKTPAAELDEERISLKDRIDITHDAILNTDQRVVEVKDQIAAKEKEFKGFQDLLKPVFAISRAKVVYQGAYPIRLEYKHECSKFQSLCALPKGQAQALGKLALKLDDSIPCTRYAEIR